MLNRKRNRLPWSALAVVPLSLAAAPDTARFEQSSPDGGGTWDAGPRDAPCCQIVELRRYTLHPGRRDTLIDLFDRHFAEEQEATGIQVVGQFRDLDRPDVFTWVRGFPDMASRAASLGAFYGGPVWAAHREAANSTMIDSDNVLLLRPASPGSGFVLGGRAPAGATAIPPGLVVATVYTLAPPLADGFPAFFRRTVAPRLAASGARPIAVFETEPAPNTFPRLPVREGERAFVWFARFADPAEYERHVETLRRDRRWTAEVLPDLRRRLASPAEILRLTPTARSRTFR